MNLGRTIAALGLLSISGCWLTHSPAPEEVALDVYQDAEELLASESYEAAAKKYEFVIQARDRWKDPYLKLARCREALGRKDQAIQVLNQLLSIDQFDLDALAKLGRLWADSGENARALEYYRRLRDLSPGNRQLEREIARLEAAGKP